MSTPRSESLTVGYSSQPGSNSPTANTPPADSSGTAPTSALRSPFGLPGAVSSTAKMTSAARSGTGSPSHDVAASGRLFSKRAREIQAQEGLPVNPWGGPPASGSSTPLRENIPESPTDAFANYGQLQGDNGPPVRGRARAGTVPSRFPGAPNGLLPLPNLPNLLPNQTQAAPPFPGAPPGLNDIPEASAQSTSALLQRLRAGSLPQQAGFIPNMGAGSPFGPSIFSSWNPRAGRDRASTLASIASVGSNGPSSPAQSTLSRDGMAGDNHIKTLDYLGLAETPQQPRAQLATPYIPNINDLKKANRIRSYSVNNQDKYADDDGYDESDVMGYTSYAERAAALSQEIAATNAAIQRHNMSVQGLAAFAQTSRPRARTVAGIMDPPPMRVLNQYYTPGAHLDPSLVSAEIRLPEDKDFTDLPQAVAAMSLGQPNNRNNGGLLNPDEQGLEGPTSALWLGSIPTSTTTSTLTEMFKSYGPILSARVLTHKNCGFVNFERTESAVAAKTTMNGKEIFPGAGPIRINFAKPPSASNTPGHDGVFPSPSPDPFSKSEAPASTLAAAPAGDTATVPAAQSHTIPTVPPLRDMVPSILDIVKQFGATEDDKVKISRSLNKAIAFTNFTDEVAAIKDPTHTRVHDAPKLRDIRKRIDNQSLSEAEIEDIAVNMLPEIAELASDYLGNTVVQKLFEHCSDELRDAMLGEIAPHMAEIGVHKNGTWAAQKIIDVCSTPTQLNLIVEHVRPYTVPLFLDQYGNYVVQGCLKFCSPFNDFIFETMLSRMWEVSQGRYGARAMRACLESHHSTKDQQRMLAAAIALHSVQLATNANGALLLTWFLDTCTFPQRRTVLSPRLVPNLVHLCTHKVAYLTVLKVINQKAEPEARDIILKALFFTPKDHVLEAILSDHACGATLIFKVLTTPFFDESIRSQVVETVKAVLVRIKAQPNQGYKRLMDEVGLSTRAGGAGRDHSTHGDRQRPASRQTSGGHAQQPGQFGGNNQPGPGKPPQGQFYGQYNPEMGFSGPQQQQRGEGSDPNMQPFPNFPNSPMYNPNMPMPYQQGMGNRGTPPAGKAFPPGFNGPAAPPAPGVDQFRGANPPGGSFPPGFTGAPMGAGGGNGFSYGDGVLQDQPNGRRGRVSVPRTGTPGAKGGSKNGSKSRSSSRY